MGPFLSNGRTLPWRTRVGGGARRLLPRERRGVARSDAHQRSQPRFFRASDEYQLCGGLDYYTRRYVLLLSPANWVPPTYLAGGTDQLFTPRAIFQRVWRGGEAVLVSDDVPDVGNDAIPIGPYSVVSRAGTRVLLRAAVSTANQTR